LIGDQLTSAWAQYTLKLTNRGLIENRLKASGIPSVVYYPKPLTIQEGYSHFPKVSGGTPVSEMLAKSVLSLPMHPYLDKRSQDRIMEVLHSKLD